MNDLKVDTVKIDQYRIGREQADQVIDLANGVADTLSADAKEAFWIKIRNAIPIKEPTQAVDPDQAGIIGRVLRQCDTILRLAKEMPDTPDANKFAASITATVQSIRNQAESQNRITQNQRTALDNIEKGVRSWNRERDYDDD